MATCNMSEDDQARLVWFQRLGGYDGDDIQVEDKRTRTACMVESGHTDDDDK